jgi:hypothetical protein
VFMHGILGLTLWGRMCFMNIYWFGAIGYSKLLFFCMLILRKYWYALYCCLLDVLLLVVFCTAEL